MHILYLHQYFRSPAQGGALRSYYISQALVKAGHSVTVITAHNQAGYLTRTIDGIEVHYLPVAYSNNFSMGQRILAFARFMWTSYRLAAKQKNIDLVYATSTPLTVGLTALALLKMHRKPYVFEVRDLWPEAPIQLGYIRNKWLIKGLRWLEKVIYQNAQHLIALSPGMEAGVRKAAPEKPISMLPNMADCDYYRPTEKPQNYRSLAVKHHFVISYTGALGRANRTGFLIALAEACAKASLPNLLFLIAGSGAEEEQLKAEAQRKNLTSVHFLGELNREEIRALLAASDATYTSFDTVPVLQTNSPNKFFDSLAAGKVCLVNTKGWLQDLVEQNRCGFYLDPENPAAATDVLQQLQTDQSLLRLYQANARLLAEQEFSRERITTEVVRVIESSGQPKA